MIVVARRKKAPTDAADRLLECAATSDFTWQVTLAAWRARFGMSDREIYERAAKASLANNPWQPRRGRAGRSSG